jgi:hypothetical protein
MSAEPASSLSAESPDQAMGTDQFIADILSGHDLGIPLESYLVARCGGATHDEVLQVAASGIDLVLYARARQAGATHAEVLAAADLEYNKKITGYARARQAGATLAQVVEAITLSVQLSAANYARLLEAGVTHAEAIDHTVVRRPFPYRRARNLGATHAEIAALNLNSGSLNDYIASREAGNDHQAALSAVGRIHALTIPSFETA